MTVNFIIYGVFAYFLGLFFAGLLALSRKYFNVASKLFVFSNVLGFIVGVLYLSGFIDKQLVLVNSEWFFGFAPSLNFLSAIFFTLTALVAMFVGVFGMRYLALYEKTYNKFATQFLTAIFVLGMQGVFLANNAFAFLFFWEVMSIASFFLVLAERTRESVQAAFLYFIMTHLGAGAIMGGFLILSHGSLLFDFASIGNAASALSPTMLALAFLLFLFGFGSKAGLVPFHVWLPEAHPQAPSNVSALMSGLMLKVAVYGFIKIIFSFAGLPEWTGFLVIGLGLLSAIVGVLYAAVERDLKRAFAYSSIENLGIIFTMLGLALILFTQGTEEKTLILVGEMLAFAIFHAISHAFFKTGLFLSSGVIINRFHLKSLDLMGGLAKIMPFFSLAFLLTILSSLPLPPFATFYGEWGLLQSIVGLLHSSQLGVDVVAVMILALSLVGLVSGLAVFAMVKIFGISMLGLPRTKHLDERNEKEDMFLIVPIFLLGFAVVVLGIFAKYVLGWFMQNLSFAKLPSVETVSVELLPSVIIFAVPLIFLGVVYAIKKLFAPGGLQREYHTWDCGQPIDSSMEYTASAFSAPIRFFFLQILGREKTLKSKPILETNPWIRKYIFSMSLGSVWQEKLYEPVAKIMNILAEKARAVQSGRIQYYLLFLLATLIVTLIIVL